MQTGNVVEHEELNADVNRLSLISWGSVVAGLVFCVALSWLLYLLGLAIGVSVTDATDAEAIGSGLGTGAVIWIVLSSLLVFFLGAMLTARLSGKHDKTIGMLHGVTLWGAVTTLMLILGVAGITGLLQIGQKVVSSTATVTANTAASLGGGATGTLDYLAQNASEVMDSKIVNNIQARLKRQASKLIASADAQGGADVSQRDVSKAIEQLDSDVLQDIAVHLIDGDTEKAKEALAKNTDLTERQIEDLTKGFSQEVEGMKGEIEDELAFAKDVQDRVEGQFASFIAGLDAPGGSQLTTQEVRSALEELDIDTLQSAAMQLLQGNTEGAKDILAARTNLTDAQINDLVDGVNQEVEQTLAKYQDELNEATETVATYTQAVVWAVFAASAIGLALAILGGSIGAATSKRLYTNSRQIVI